MRFSTDAVAPGNRVAAWREAYGQTIAKLQFEPVSEGPFTVEATLRSFPGLGVASMSTQGLRFSKPRNLIDSDDLILVMVESGGYSGRQLGREVNLAPGDAVVRLNAEVASGQIFGRPSIIRVPMKAILPLVGDVAAAVQRRIPADTDALRLLRSYMRTVPDCVATPAFRRLAASHVHDLVALLLGATGDGAEVAKLRGGRAARLRAIKADIADHLGGGLSVAGVAARHRLAVRYVQRLFEAEGITFTEFVLEERLARAHKMLSDVRLVEWPVSVIALDVGFDTLSYFNHSFRRRFGLSPSDVRAQARSDN